MVSFTEQTDFKVDDTYFFEIGGKNKKSKQIVTLENSYIVADDIEYGFQHKIPLWLFGFMYWSIVKFSDLIFSFF